jgi:anti-sigma B factor antagonist
MNLNTEIAGDIVTVTFQDESLDAGSSKDFRDSIAPILEAHSKVVFDLTSLQFVDSSGLGAILSCLRKLNAEGGDLKLACVSKPVRTLFELVRMHKIFDIFNTREEAMTAFEG